MNERKKMSSGGGTKERVKTEGCVKITKMYEKQEELLQNVNKYGKMLYIMEWCNYTLLKLH